MLSVITCAQPSGSDIQSERQEFADAGMCKGSVAFSSIANGQRYAIATLPPMISYHTDTFYVDAAQPEPLISSMLRKVAMALGLMAGGYALAAEPAPRTVAASIRNTGGGWYAISDHAHKPVGIAKVTSTADSIMASVELDHAIVQCSRKRLFRDAIVDPATLTAPVGNLWIFGVFY